MKTVGEKKIGIKLNSGAETVFDLIKIQGVQWINLAEKFRQDHPTEKKDRLIAEAQELFKQATEKLIEATE